MTTTNAKMRQLIGTTADWAANNIVLGSGEIGVERVSASDVRIKIGDGAATWSALPYASASSTSVNAATQAALDAKVAKAGDTMTGLLILSGDAVAAKGAVTKQQLDGAVSTLNSSINGKLGTSGGTMTGALNLAADPTSPLHAATRQYVDAIVAAHVSKSGDTMTGPLVLSGPPAASLEAATKDYVDNGGYQTVVGGAATYAGKVVKLNAQGVIDQSLVPITAAYLGTVNPTIAYTLSGTYRTGDYFSVSVGGTVDASWQTRINGSPTTAAAGQDLIFNSNGKWDLVGDTIASVALGSKVDKAGDTMTGALTLAGNPTAALDAAPKQYVDTMLPKAGGTMTGALVLAGNPTAALDAAPKQYVDAQVAGITGFLPLGGGTLTGALTLSGAPTSGLHAATKTYVDGIQTALTTAYQNADTALTTAYQTADNNRVNKGGDTMTGALTLSGNPTSALHAATRQYVDTADALALKKASNLSDLANAATARTSLGLKTGALVNISVGTTAPASPVVNDIWVDTN